MSHTISTIVYLIVALIVISLVGSLVLSVLGLFFGLIPLLIKLAFWGVLIYLGFMVFRKFAEKKAG